MHCLFKENKCKHSPANLRTETDCHSVTLIMAWKGRGQKGGKGGKGGYGGGWENRELLDYVKYDMWSRADEKERKAQEDWQKREDEKEARLVKYQAEQTDKFTKLIEAQNELTRTLIENRNPKTCSSSPVAEGPSAEVAQRLSSLQKQLAEERKYSRKRERDVEMERYHGWGTSSPPRSPIYLHSPTWGGDGGMGPGASPMYHHSPSYGKGGYDYGKGGYDHAADYGTHHHGSGGQAGGLFTTMGVGGLSFGGNEPPQPPATPRSKGIGGLQHGAGSSPDGGIVYDSDYEGPEPPSSSKSFPTTAGAGLRAMGSILGAASSGVGAGGAGVTDYFP